MMISARALDNAGGKTAAGGVAIGKLAFDATVAGPITRPHIEAKLNAADVSAPQGKLKALAARFAIKPETGAAAKAAPIPFTADDACERGCAERSRVGTRTRNFVHA